jgi:hypothetical protein
LSHVKLAELLNVSTTYTFNGKTYGIKEANITQRAEYASWVQDCATAFIERQKQKGILSEDGYVAALKGLSADVAAQKYEFESELCLAALGTPAGATQFIYIMLREQYPEVTEEVAAAMYKAQIKQVNDNLEKMKNDPKALRGLADLLLGKNVSGSSATGRKTQSPSKRSKNSRQRK